MNIDGDDDAPIVPAAGDGEQAGKETQSNESTETETEENGDGEEDSETETSEDAGEPGGEGSGDDDEDKGEDGDEPEKPKKTSRSERYKRQVERLKAQLAQTRSTPQRGSTSDADVAAEVDRQIGPKPDEKDFKGDFVEFERAMAAYNVDKRLTTRDVRKSAEATAKVKSEQFADLVDEHKERVVEFRTKVKDFNEVITKASKDGAKASPVVESLILESDKSAHVVYYLAKNPAVIEKLNDMSEREAAREIGRIEAKLSLPQPNKQTQARRPVAPVRGGVAPVSQEAALDAWLKKKYG